MFFCLSFAIVLMFACSDDGPSSASKSTDTPRSGDTKTINTYWVNASRTDFSFPIYLKDIAPPVDLGSITLHQEDDTEAVLDDLSTEKTDFRGDQYHELTITNIEPAKIYTIVFKSSKWTVRVREILPTLDVDKFASERLDLSKAQLIGVWDPTCSPCIEFMEEVRAIIARSDTVRDLVQLNVFWVPVLGIKDLKSDDLSRHEAAAKNFASISASDDVRLDEQHYWDPVRQASHKFSPPLGISPDYVWDILMIYEAGNRLVANPDAELIQLEGPFRWLSKGRRPEEFKGDEFDWEKSKVMVPALLDMLVERISG